MENAKAASPLPSAAVMAGLDRRRRWRDALANLVIGFGGVFVIVAITLIFFYLMFEVWPLFKRAEFDQTRQYQSVQSVPAGFMSVDEYSETAMRMGPNGELQFFKVSTGEQIGGQSLNLPAGVSVASVQRGSVLKGLSALGLSNGQLLVFKPEFEVSYDAAGARQVTPRLKFPYGEQPLSLGNNVSPLTTFAIRGADEGLQVLAVRGPDLVWSLFTEQQAEGELGMAMGLGMGGEEDEAKTFSLSQSQSLPLPQPEPRFVSLGAGGRWGYVFSGDADVAIFDLNNENGPRLYQQTQVVAEGQRVTQVLALQGDVSMLVADNTGRISQWFQVRDQASQIDKFSFTKIRDFKLGDAPISALAVEERRKGFFAGDEKGQIGYFYTTSERTLRREQAFDSAIRQIAVSPRSDGVLVQADKGASFWALHAEHPDISWSSSWGKVWYESYPEPSYTWQSTSCNTDFESKMSLMPLTFGTLKAAFYAMLLAAPLAVCAAMYTAVFMAPALRRRVKPAIELMQSLPTVILGFLAGLWLAPVVENYLPGIFSMLVVTPIIIIACGYAWMQLPLDFRNRLGEGWTPLLLVLPILIGGWLSFELSRPVENVFFGGDVRQWLDSIGIKFDQRNSLVIGLVMGFAIIAPIFSIAEDALFAVPKHLTNGSLALGATAWQTLVYVVLPTASPGIFSALMIGFGRAVGETMIVLMATGNTAVMEWNIFEGMRTLSANVAVEMGEAEVGSTHFRMLFLSALVLFVLTFVVNTVAEVVRSRLRKKYGSL